MSKNRQAMKRNRQSKEFNLKNRAFKTRIKNVVKEFEAETDANKKGAVLNRAFSLFDKAGQKHIMHPGTAARKKSKLAKRLNTFLSESKQAAE